MSPLPVRAEPDPTLPGFSELAPGDEVAVLSWRGAWADVMALSGVRGWVDGGQLVQSQPVPAAQAPTAPASPPAPVPAPMRPPDNRERNGWIFIGVVAAMVAVAAVLIAGSGSGSAKGASRSTSPSAPASTTSSPATNPVKYTIPPAWSASDDGLVVAEKESDLTASKPTGARITATLTRSNEDPAAIVQKQLSKTSSFDVIEPPIDTATVSGVKAVRTTLRQGDQIVQFIAVHPPGHDGVLFTVECPTDHFEQVQDAINTAPGLNL